jgi:allophanate hydrolase subunit 2
LRSLSLGIHRAISISINGATLAITIDGANVRFEAPVSLAEGSRLMITV